MTRHVLKVPSKVNLAGSTESAKDRPGCKSLSSSHDGTHDACCCWLVPVAVHADHGAYSLQTSQCSAVAGTAVLCVSTSTRDIRPKMRAHQLCLYACLLLVCETGPAMCCDMAE